MTSRRSSRGRSAYHCPRCAQSLPKRWWSETVGGYFLCPCGARLTSRVNPIWAWPLIVLWGGGTGVYFDRADFTPWEAGLLGALAAGVFAAIAHVMFYRPIRARNASGERTRGTAAPDR